MHCSFQLPAHPWPNNAPRMTRCFSAAVDINAGIQQDLLTACSTAEAGMEAVKAVRGALADWWTMPALKAAPWLKREFPAARRAGWHQHCRPSLAIGLLPCYTCAAGAVANKICACCALCRGGQDRGRVAAAAVGAARTAGAAGSVQGQQPPAVTSVKTKLWWAAGVKINVQEQKKGSDVNIKKSTRPIAFSVCRYRCARSCRAVGWVCGWLRRVACCPAAISGSSICGQGRRALVS